MLGDWMPQLGDEAIRRNVGPESYRRGAAYAQSGRVLSLQTQPKVRTLTASVLGSDVAPYTVLVTAQGGSWTGYCTCPMETDCKHVAAALLAARAADRLAETEAPAPGPQLRPWERSLAELLPHPSGADTAGTPVALQFDLAPAPPPGRPRSSSVVRRLRIRPVVPGRAATWVRSGISWRELQYDYGYARRARAHEAALRELHAAHRPSQGGYYYSSSDLPVYLDEFGPPLWLLLEQLVDAGVALVAAKGTPAPVTLSRIPAEVELDLRQPGPRAAAVLDPIVRLDGRAVQAATVTFLGDPAHGVVLGTGGTGGAGPAGLLLAPLAARVTAPVIKLLTSGKPLSVPAADLDRFRREYYPGLRRVIGVRSSDGTVQLPDIAGPRIGLRVRYTDDHGIELAWSFRYPVADDVRSVPLSDPIDGLRDPHAERQLLAALQPQLERLPRLREPTPERALLPEAELRGMDAVLFATDVLPALRGQPEVDVEESGEAPCYRQADEAPLVRLSATDSPDTDWFDLGITVSVGEEEIPFQALFLALAAGETHLVLASGTWLSIERPEFDQLRRLIEEARALQDVESDGLKISRYQAGLWEELLELGVVDAQSERWARSVGGLLGLDDLAPADPPPDLAATLRPYQLQGFQWLSFLWDHGLGGILADDMGLGKTVQTLALLCRARAAGQLTDPVLVVAPTSVVANWAHEAARFAQELSVASVTETTGRRGVPLAEQVAGAHLVITSYALFRIDEEAYASLPWRGLVLDEAQFVKNHQAKAYQCARKLPAPFKLAITGTPLENSLMDLWSLLSITAPGLFPNPKRFTDFYRKPIERGADPELLATLRRRIRPLLLRRTKERVAAELPAKQEQVLDVALNPKHRTIYQRHLQRERQKVLGLLDDLDRNRFTIFRSLTLLRQLSLDPALVDEQYAGVRPSKVDLLLEHLTEVLAEGHRALVFSQFTGFLGTVRRRLDAEGITYAYLDGRTRDRAVVIDRFKSGDVPVFLISLKAGGFGLNLTEADYCFVLDPWWNPAVEAQAVDRTHRIGQDKTVMVYRLVAEDTIEQKVMELKARKAELFSRVMDDGALMSAPLTADDIKALFAP